MKVYWLYLLQLLQWFSSQFDKVDIAVLVACGFIFIGLYQIYPSAAWVTVGIVILTFAFMGVRK